MAMQIEYSPVFKDTFKDIMSCGQKYYKKNVLKSTFSSLRKYKDLLATNPLMGTIEPSLISHKEGYRYVILNKTLKLIYYIDENVVYFTDIWDTRVSPSTLSSRLD